MATQAPVAVCADDVRKCHLHCIERLLHGQWHLSVGGYALETAAAVVQTSSVGQCLRCELPYSSLEDLFRDGRILPLVAALSATHGHAPCGSGD